MEARGYAGRILYVDLTSGKIEARPLDLDLARKYVGGWGLNARLAYDLVPPGVDPLSPENPIVLGAGLLSGTGAPGAPKAFLTTRDPDSGTVSTGVGSGFFGARLKWAGYDHVVITGRAPRPVYLKVLDDDVEIRDARPLWGKDIVETTDALFAEHGKACSVACIGQAGENRVKLSLVLIDKITTIGRTFGGALGAKNLKAIVVGGTKGLRVAHPERFGKIADALVERGMKDPLRESWASLGLFYIQSIWEKAGHIRRAPGDTSHLFTSDDYLKIKKCTVACPVCVAGDKAILEIREGQFAGTDLPISTTSMAASGMRWGFPSKEHSVKYVSMCNRYGVDIAWSQLLEACIQMFKDGALTGEDTGGVELGTDYETAMRLLEMVAHRRGFGDLLGQGWLGMIESLGPRVERYAYHIKGARPDFDARVSFGVEAFGAVVNPRPACDYPVGGLTVAVGRDQAFFMKRAEAMGFPKEALGRIFVPPGFDLACLQPYYEHWATLHNCLGACFRMQVARLYDIEVATQLYTAATGMDVEPQELLASAERAYNVYKAANVRQGFSRKDDRFPHQWFQPLPVGDREVVLMDYFRSAPVTREGAERMLDTYYRERGWDVATGIPTPERLAGLGLGPISADLEPYRQA